MRLLHVINSLVVGGAERLLKDTVNGICRTHPGLQQHLVTLYEGGALRDGLDTSVHYRFLHATRLNFILKARELRNYILENRIDVVHAHLYDAMIMARLSLPQGVKLVNTYHSSMYNPSSAEYSFKRKLIDRLTSGKTHHTVFVSETVRENIMRELEIRGPFTVVPNFSSPVFHHVYKHKEDNGLRMVSVGTLRHPKNHEHSIAVLAQLKDYDISLDIYGYGPMENTMREMIRASGAKVNIINDHIVDCSTLAKYDVFLMSSLQEGMSIALLEAIACGLPSVVSDIPSLRETAVNSAFFFSLKGIHPAANTLLHIYRNREVLRDLSENARKLSARYSLESHLNSLLAIYSGK